MGRKRVALIGTDYEHKKKIVSGLGITQVLPKKEGLASHSYNALYSDDIQLNLLGSEVLKTKERTSDDAKVELKDRMDYVPLRSTLKDREVILLQFDASQEGALSKLKDTIAYLKQEFKDDVSKITLVGTYHSTKTPTITLEEIQELARENDLNTDNAFLINLGEPDKEIGNRLDGVKEFIAPANSVAPALQTAQEAVSTMPAHHRSAYDKLWKENLNAKDNMIALLDDYAKGNNGFKLFFTAHANRNRKATKAVNGIVKQLKAGRRASWAVALEGGICPYGITEAYRDLCNITVKEGGSLHSRLTFLKAKLLESDNLPENLHHTEFKVDTNASRIFTPRA